MKKSLVCFFAAFNLLLSSVCAVEWGGILNEEAYVESSDFKAYPAYQSNSAYLWMTIPFTADGSWKLSTEAMYKYDYYFAIPFDASQSSFTNIADLDLLKLSGSFDAGLSTISLNLGRFMVSDSSGVVFSQNSDGLLIDFSLPAFKASVYGGFTGLLNSLNVTMIDADGNTFESNAPYGFYSLSHYYVPVIASFTLPSLFANQTLGLEGEAVLDVQSGFSGSYYGTFAMNGPISNVVYYSLTTTFGSQDFKNLMNFTNAAISVFPVEGISASFGVRYASGKGDWIFDNFRTITSQTAYNSVEAPQLTGVVLPNVSVAFGGNKYYVSAGVTGILQVSSSEVLKGFEGDISATYSIFSDLSLGADINAYYDVLAATNSNYKATVKAAVSF